MGCWNGTCMISNLPIDQGDPIVSFVIKYNRLYFNLGSGICNSTDVAIPISFGIKGTYNSYGGIENVATNDIVNKHLYKQLKTDKFSTQKFLELMKYIEKINQKTQASIADSGIGDNLGLVIINSDIFNSLISSYKNNLTTKKIENAMTILSLSNEYVRNTKNINDNRSFDYISKYSYGKVIDQLEIDIENKEQEYYCSLLKHGVISIKKTPSKKNKITKDLYNAIKEKYIISILMCSLRKTWIAPCGRGLQHWSYDEHLTLTDAIKKHIISKKSIID